MTPEFTILREFDDSPHTPLNMAKNPDGFPFTFFFSFHFLLSFLVTIVIQFLESRDIESVLEEALGTISPPSGLHNFEFHWIIKIILSISDILINT